MVFKVDRIIDCVVPMIPNHQGSEQGKQMPCQITTPQKSVRHVPHLQSKVRNEFDSYLPSQNHPPMSTRVGTALHAKNILDNSFGKVKYLPNGEFPAC
jgi:hypothetical protein